MRKSRPSSESKVPTVEEEAGQPDRYEGRYVGDTIHDGLRHGSGRLEFCNGDCYEGDFKYGMREGKGTLTYGRNARRDFYDSRAYTGEWRGSLRHGRGREKWPSGEWYEGQWEKDKFHGQGAYRSRCGRYDGDFAYGEKSGKGKMSYFKEGGTYEGEWQKNRFHGAGTYVWPDDTAYEGHWQRGLRHGVGSLSQPSGEKYYGHWANGLKHGKGTIRHRNGRCRDGIWKRNHLLNYTSNEYYGAKIHLASSNIYKKSS